jgi:nucleoside triphosphate pyrophosphatase
MILLTSLSKRRIELLHQIGFRAKEDFVQVDIPLNYEYQNVDQKLTLEEVELKAEQAARLKVVRAVKGGFLRMLALHPEETVVVGADTVIYFQGRVLDRPLLVNREDATPKQISHAEQKAREMLAALSGGKDFYVITGLAVAQGDNLTRERACSVTTKAKLKNISEQDIERYIRTGEPLDKAGGFGIQERGVALFESIKGSYSNVVGLPLLELVELLSDPLFEGRVQFRIAHREPSVSDPVQEGSPELRVVAVGDINYDIGFNRLPEGFFEKLSPPGDHILGELYRGTGGTAPIFALRARAAGFKQCSVLGVIGGDALGKFIEEDLNRSGIRTLLPADYKARTGIAIVLRDEAENDTALTITDSQQALSTDDINKVRAEIEKTHMVFVSGYSLTDPKRRRAVLQVMEWAKQAGQLVVLDVVVHMEKAFDFAALTEMTRGKVDVLVSEIPPVLTWLGAGDRSQSDWDFIKGEIIPQLTEHFHTVFLRTSTYSHEVVVSTPNVILGPIELDYSRRPPEKRLGYADEITAQHLYQFMSPRLLMASASPRRFALLKQIVSDNKIEVLASNLPEELDESEDPESRVRRLSLAKAQAVLALRERFSPSIEIVIGADTEVVLDGQTLGQPSDDQAAREMLKRLSDRTHETITGLALIDIRTGEQFQDCVSTKVKFKKLSDPEIEQYVMSGEPIGKAGAYGIQGKGALFIKSIEGSYSNVVGLPLERLSQILSEKFNLPIWDIDRVSSRKFPQR